MKYFRMFAFILMLSTLLGCLGQDELKKIIIDAFTTMAAIDRLCFNEPIIVKFDPSKPNDLQVQVSISNGSSLDVVASIDVELILFSGSIAIGTGKGTISNVLFPKSQAVAYTSPFIIIKSNAPLKVGESYVINAQKYLPWVNYTIDEANPLRSSCYNYNHSFTLRVQ